MSETTKSGLTPVAQKFILHWGEMGTRWGINRTVAQVHALLFLSPKPVPADEISTTLAVARSNVSTCLRELQGWGIVRVVHVLGRSARSLRIPQGCLGDFPDCLRRTEAAGDRSDLARDCGVCGESKANPQGDAVHAGAVGEHAGVLDGDDGLFDEDSADADGRAQESREAARQGSDAAGKEGRVKREWIRK